VRRSDPSAVLDVLRFVQMRLVTGFVMIGQVHERRQKFRPRPTGSRMGKHILPAATTTNSATVMLASALIAAPCPAPSALRGVRRAQGTSIGRKGKAAKSVGQAGLRK